jgi:hypothetical protein
MRKLAIGLNIIASMLALCVAFVLDSNSGRGEMIFVRLVVLTFLVTPIISIHALLPFKPRSVKFLIFASVWIVSWMVIQIVNSSPEKEPPSIEQDYSYVKCPGEYKTPEEHTDTLARFVSDKRTNEPGISEEQVVQDFRDTLANLGCPLSLDP